MSVTDYASKATLTNHPYSPLSAAAAAAVITH
jgi:hypothetical protein